MGTKPTKSDAKWCPLFSIKKTTAVAATLFEILSSSDYNNQCSPNVFTIKKMIIFTHHGGIKRWGCSGPESIVCGYGFWNFKQSPWHLVKMQMLRWGLKFCISNKLSKDASCPWRELWGIRVGDPGTHSRPCTGSPESQRGINISGHLNTSAAMEGKCYPQAY